MQQLHRETCEACRDYFVTIKARVRWCRSCKDILKQEMADLKSLVKLAIESPHRQIRDEATKEIREMFFCPVCDWNGNRPRPPSLPSPLVPKPSLESRQAEMKARLRGPKKLARKKSDGPFPSRRYPVGPEQSAARRLSASGAADDLIKVQPPWCSDPRLLDIAPRAAVERFVIAHLKHRMRHAFPYRFPISRQFTPHFRPKFIPHTLREEIAEWKWFNKWLDKIQEEMEEEMERDSTKVPLKPNEPTPPALTDPID
jgi:hypothetical protein